MRLVLIGIVVFHVHLAYAQFSLPGRDAIADIDFYNSTLEAVHYNPYLYIGKEEYKAKIDSIKASVGD